MNNIGTLVIAPIRPQAEADTYPVAYANELKGGLHTVQNTTIRDAIPEERRVLGMQVYVIDDETYYTLIDGVENADWEIVTFQGELGALGDVDTSSLANGYLLTYNLSADTWDSFNPATRLVTLTDNQTITGDKTFTGTVNLSAASLVLPGDLTALDALSSTGIAVRTGTDTWVQRSVAGTTNRISITNGNGVSGDITVDISSSYVGQATITTVGTISTGEWNATPIADGKIASALTGKTYNNLSLTAAATGFTIAGGTSSKTLSVLNTITLAASADSVSLNIGNGGVLGTGAFQPQTVIVGTSNQISVTNGGVGSTQLSLPQDIAITSAVRFGSLGIGAAPSGNDLLLISSGANTDRRATISNTTSGTASSAEYRILTTGNAQVALRAYSSGFTQSGLQVPGSASLTTSSGLSGGLYIRTETTAPIVFGINNVEYARFTTTGVLSARNVDIEGGSIDGVTIGGSSRGSGYFTVVEANAGISAVTSNNLSSGTNGFYAGVFGSAVNLTGSINITGFAALVNAAAAANSRIVGTFVGRSDPNSVYAIAKLNDAENAGVTGYSIVFDTNGATQHNFYIGSSSVGTITSTGINNMAIGASTRSTGAFTTLTLTSALTVANGGTGATTLTGYVKGNGTSAFTASATIPNTDITGLGTMSTQAASAVDIDGGSIDATIIGAVDQARGNFTIINIGDGNAEELYALRIVRTVTASPVGEIWGFLNEPRLNASDDGDILIGEEVAPLIGTSTFTGLQYYGIKVANALASGSGTVSDYYGIYIEEPTTGTNKHALYVAGGVSHFGGLLTTTATLSSSAGFRLPHGTTPDAPEDGDLWTTDSGIYVQINGSTVGPLGTGMGDGDGDVSSNTASSVDSEVVLFSGTGGKTIKRASGSGIAKLTSGVLSVVTAPTGDIVGTSDTQSLTGKTYNGLTLTAATSGFTIAGGTTSKTLTMLSTLTFVGTDASVLNIGNGGTLGSAAFQNTSAFQPADAALTALAAGSDFVQFTGPTTSTKTFTLPNATCTILTTNAAVTVAQGGTGATTLTGYVKGNGTSAFTASATIPGADITQQMSITSDGSGLKLSGDSATPGNSKYYGTDSGGTKGWFDLPAGSGSSVFSDLVAADATNTIDNDAYTQEWQWNGLDTPNTVGLKLSTTSLLSAAGVDEYPSVLSVQVSGINAINNQTSYAARFSNFRAGGSGVSVSSIAIGAYATEAHSGSNTAIACYALDSTAINTGIYLNAQGDNVDSIGSIGVQITSARSETNYGVYSLVGGNGSYAIEVTNYGGYFRALGGETTYGVYINAAGGTVDNYAVYAVAGYSYFAENVSIGTTSNIADQALRIQLGITAVNSFAASAYINSTLTASGSDNNLYGAIVEVPVAKNGETVNSFRALYISDGVVSGSGTLTTKYGIYVDAQTGGSTNYSVYVADGASYFGGTIQCTDTTEATTSDAGSLRTAGGIYAAKAIVAKRWETAHSTLTYSASAEIDFTAQSGLQTVSLTGNITFTTANRAAGRGAIVRIVCDASGRTLTFPSWKFIGGSAPTSIAANKTAILSMTCFGSNDTDIIATYAVES